jgi:hypothetical protein
VIQNVNCDDPLPGYIKLIHVTEDGEQYLKCDPNKLDSTQWIAIEQP